MNKKIALSSIVALISLSAIAGQPMRGTQAIDALKQYRYQDEMTGDKGCKISFKDVTTEILGSAIVGLEVKVTDKSGAVAETTLYVVDSVTQNSQGIDYSLNGLDRSGAAGLKIVGADDDSAFSITLTTRSGKKVFCRNSNP